MITEVDEALCRLFGARLPGGTVVRLDPPKPTWQVERASNAIDLFLFGLRDVGSGNETGQDDDPQDGAGQDDGRQDGAGQRDAGQMGTGQRGAEQRGVGWADAGAVRRCELSYLVTARAEKVHEEHWLLDRALRTAMFVGALPAECLLGSLAESGLPVYLRVADDGPGSLWTSLGMPARAAFVMTVSVPAYPL